MTGASRATPGAYRGYIFDLDGTIYLGDALLPGALELLTELRRRQARVLFLSNNPTKNRDMYVAKLRGLGITADLSEILNTVVTMTAWLQQNADGRKVFVLGEAPLTDALRAGGIEFSSDPAEIGIVVASYDRGFTYAKLQTAFDAITLNGAILVTTNPDGYCPFPGGRGEPDAGAIVAAIEASTGTRCVVNAGKPDALMLQTAMDILELAPTDCVMVGDRLYTDIAMALRAGMDSALVLTGETTSETLAAAAEDQRPTFVLNRIDELVGATG